MENYFLMLLCLAASINVIYFHMELQTLTWPNFECVESTGLCCDKPLCSCSIPLLRSLHELPVKFRTDFKICLLTCKTLSEKHPVYLLTLLVASLPSRSLRSHKGIALCVPSVKTNVTQGHFALAPVSCGTSSHYLSV